MNLQLNKSFEESKERLPKIIRVCEKLVLIILVKSTKNNKSTFYFISSWAISNLYQIHIIYFKHDVFSKDFARVYIICKSNPP